MVCLATVTLSFQNCAILMPSNTLPADLENRVQMPGMPHRRQLKDFSFGHDRLCSTRYLDDLFATADTRQPAPEMGLLVSRMLTEHRGERAL